jgi:hypothetical protein
MRRRSIACAVLLLGALAALATRAECAPWAGHRPAHARAHARKARADTTRRSLAAAPRAGGMPRTLADVHIEGEVSMPQVLFITARDQRRFMDFQHHHFLRTSTQLGEATPLPAWVLMSHDPIDPQQETPR